MAVVVRVYCLCIPFAVHLHSSISTSVLETLRLHLTHETQLHTATHKILPKLRMRRHHMSQSDWYKQNITQYAFSAGIKNGHLANRGGIFQQNYLSMVWRRNYIAVKFMTHANRLRYIALRAPSLRDKIDHPNPLILTRLPEGIEEFSVCWNMKYLRK